MVLGLPRRGTSHIRRAASARHPTKYRDKFVLTSDWRYTLSDDTRVAIWRYRCQDVGHAIELLAQVCYIAVALGREQGKSDQGVAR